MEQNKFNETLNKLHADIKSGKYDNSGLSPQELSAALVVEKGLRNEQRPVSGNPANATYTRIFEPDFIANQRGVRLPTYKNLTDPQKMLELEDRIALAEDKLETAKAKRKAAVNSRPSLALVNGKPRMKSGTEKAGIDQEMNNARYELEAAQREKYFSEQTAAITQLEQSIRQTNEYQQALDRVQQQDKEAEQIENKRKMNRSAGLYDFRAGRGSTQ